MTRVPLTGQEPGCAVELTEVITGGEAWWTLAFEAAGTADLVRSDLNAAAAFMFAQALPGQAEPSMNDSRSYAEWLWRRSAQAGDDR